MNAKFKIKQPILLNMSALILCFIVLLQIGRMSHPLSAFAQSSSSAGETLISAPNRAVTADISDIHNFLEQCPTTDPIYTQLRSDITLRRNGVLVGDIPCTAPISQMPISQYTDELIYMQALRTIYYMDLGMSGHLPWTSGTLYAWLVSKIDGIDLSDTATVSTCCYAYDDGTYMIIRTQDEANRENDRQWKGISGNISLIMHEARHADGFPHNSGCGIPNGCDATYDESNLSPYGIQWWLERSWLNNDLNVEVSCDTLAEKYEVANYHLLNANNQFRLRFSNNPPPVLTLPEITCPVNLLQPSLKPNRISPTAWESVFFNATIQNMGGNADGVVLTVTLPSQTTFSYAYTSQGTVSGTGPLIFDLGTVDYLTYPIDITFEVVIDGGVTAPTALLGEATLSWNGGSNAPISYGVIANAELFTLPFINR